MTAGIKQGAGQEGRCYGSERAACGDGDSRSPRQCPGCDTAPQLGKLLPPGGNWVTGT